jgi:hypothetical protein
VRHASPSSAYASSCGHGAWQTAPLETRSLLLSLLDTNQDRREYGVFLDRKATRQLSSRALHVCQNSMAHERGESAFLAESIHWKRLSRVWYRDH